MLTKPSIGRTGHLARPYRYACPPKEELALLAAARTDENPYIEPAIILALETAKALFLCSNSPQENR